VYGSISRGAYSTMAMASFTDGLLSMDTDWCFDADVQLGCRHGGRGKRQKLPNKVHHPWKRPRGG
jgi:hypothetical protein